VLRPNWDNPAGPIANVGAVTWGNGSSGITGTVTIANSLVGSVANDLVSNSGVLALTNGHYTIRSPNWTNGSNAQAGAVTWGSGGRGIAGFINMGNSLVGINAGDRIGDTGQGNINVNEFFFMGDNWNGNRGHVTIANSNTGAFCDGTYGKSRGSVQLL